MHPLRACSLTLPLLLVSHGTPVLRPVLASPTGLSAEVLRETATLTWQAVPGAARYRVYRAGGERKPPEPVGETAGGTTLTVKAGDAPIAAFTVSAVGADGRESGTSKPLPVLFLKRPWGIAVAKDGKRYLRDAARPQTLVIGADGTPVGLFGAPDDPLTDAYDTALDRKGRLLTLTWNGGGQKGSGFVVQKPDGKRMFQYLQPDGEEPGQFQKPMGIAANGKDHIFIADTGNNRVQEFTPDGKFVRLIGVGDLRQPMKVAFDAQDRLYVADSGKNRVEMFMQDATGEYRLFKTLSDGIKEPCYVAVDALGRVFVSTNRYAGVYMFGANDKIAWNCEKATGQILSCPRGLGFDTKGNLLIVEEAMCRILTVKMPSTGYDEPAPGSK